MITVRSLFIAFFLTLSLSLIGQENFDPFAELEVVMVSSGQLYPSSKFKMNHADFNLVRDENQDTLYVQTMDPLFQTKEGYHVNTLYGDLKKEDQNNMKKMPGWGYYIELESGWQLGFCEGETCTDKKPQNNSTVKWIFKRPS